MKATELIKHLASKIAEQGDVEVLAITVEPGQFSRLHESQVRVTRIQPMQGKRTAWITTDKAHALGYDPAAAVLGIVIG